MRRGAAIGMTISLTLLLAGSALAHHDGPPQDAEDVRRLLQQAEHGHFSGPTNNLLAPTTQSAMNEAQCAAYQTGMGGARPNQCLALPPVGVGPILAGNSAADQASSAANDPPMRVAVDAHGLSVYDRDGNRLLSIGFNQGGQLVAQAEVQLKREAENLLSDAGGALALAGAVAASTADGNALLGQVPDIHCGIDTDSLNGNQNGCTVIMPDLAALFAAAVLREQGAAGGDGPDGIEPVALAASSSLPLAPEALAGASPSEEAGAPPAAAPGVGETVPNAAIVAPGTLLDPYFYAVTLIGLLTTLGLILPAYHRLVRNDILENDVRKSIYDIVAARPGLSVQAISEMAGVSHSTATYHLELLAKGGMIVSAEDGNKLRFYKNGGRFTADERAALPVLQNPPAFELLERIVSQPGIHRAELAALRGVSTTTLNWYLKKLFECGLIVEERAGRRAPNSHGLHNLGFGGRGSVESARRPARPDLSRLRHAGAAPSEAPQQARGVRRRDAPTRRAALVLHDAPDPAAGRARPFRRRGSRASLGAGRAERRVVQVRPAAVFPRRGPELHGHPDHNLIRPTALRRPLRLPEARHRSGWGARPSL